jgi:GTP-binding protein LepA
VTQVGVFAPRPVKAEALGPGEVGFFMAAIKDIHDAKIGDTVTNAEGPAAAPLPGFKAVKPMVFSGLYPTDTQQYEPLRDAMEKMRLNDSAFSYEPESSVALGFGFRCGFLGLLHMDIVRERLEREFALSLIATAPTVAYRVTTTASEQFMIDSPAKLPDPGKIERIDRRCISAACSSSAKRNAAANGRCAISASSASWSSTSCRSTRSSSTSTTASSRSARATRPSTTSSSSCARATW